MQVFSVSNSTDILNRLRGIKYFSTFDLASGFHQMQIAEEDRDKTTHTTHENHYKLMPFDLMDTPSCFSKMLSQVLLDLQDEKVISYGNIYVGFTSSLEEHDKRVIKQSDSAARLQTI